MGRYILHWYSMKEIKYHFRPRNMKQVKKFKIEMKILNRFYGQKMDTHLQVLTSVAINCSIFFDISSNGRLFVLIMTESETSLTYSTMQYKEDLFIVSKSF